MTKTHSDLPSHPSGYSPYDVAEHLRNPAEMAAYLDAWLQEAPDDASGIARALGDIARAKGMAHVEVDIDD
jgi:probable addiction module antidote protein